MRRDLNKLLCERERAGGGMSFRDLRHMKEFNNTRGEELEGLGAREGMRKRYRVRGDWKTFSENLNPLYGFVRKNIGKKWDKTFSELCEVFDMKSVINQHILQHLFDMVETKTFMEDGVVMYREGYYSQRAAAPVKSEDGPQYYVHPETGILLKNSQYKSYKTQQRVIRAKQEEEALKLRRIISETVELRRQDENSPWFMCELDVMPKSWISKRLKGYENGEKVYEEVSYPAYRYDMWEKREVDARGNYKWNLRKVGKTSRDYRPYKAGTYVAKVRLLSKKELKRFGLV